MLYSHSSISRQREVKGELHGQPRQGLVYFALNTNGEKASNPFKASLFGKQAGYVELQKHYAQSKEEMTKSATKATLKNSIEIALQLSDSEVNFKKSGRSGNQCSHKA